MIAKTFSCNVCSLILLQFVDSQSNNGHGIGEALINCNTTRSLMSCVCSALFFFRLPGILDSGVREQILLDGSSHLWTVKRLCDVHASADSRSQVIQLDNIFHAKNLMK